MTDTIRTLVILAEHADRQLVESALENDTSLEIAGYSEYLDDWHAFLEQPGDVVVVACYGHDDGVMAMVDHAVKHRPDRPVVIMSEASPNGFLRQVFEAGADDVITLPQPAEQVAFTLQKVIARRKGLAVPGRASAPLIATPGPAMVSVVVTAGSWLDRMIAPLPAKVIVSVPVPAAQSVDPA